MLARFLEVGDTNGVVYDDGTWQIREHCKRGYTPWFTLHKRRRFMRWSWWSGLIHWGERDALEQFIERWNTFGASHGGGNV